MSRIDETKDFIPVRIAVLTVSDTRTLAEDRSGQTLVDRIADAGHTLAARAILPDERAEIAEQLRAWCRRPRHRRDPDHRGHRPDGARRDGRGAPRRLREGDRGLRHRLHHRLDAEDRHLGGAVARLRRAWRTAPISSRCPAVPAPAATPGTRSSSGSSTIATGPATSSRSCRGSTNICDGNDASRVTGLCLVLSRAGPLPLRRCN